MKPEFSQFLTDVLTAAGLVAHGRQDKGLAARLSSAVVALRNKDEELEADNARLRQQRDAANAQLDFLMEEVKTRCED
ncbi:MAG: hypothetical protein [Caudoviricetes sp.]|nr:MAG: hypothetical protein [Caudoviricetes sp.]